jgi:hypothetical protein
MVPCCFHTKVKMSQGAKNYQKGPKKRQTGAKIVPEKGLKEAKKQPTGAKGEQRGKRKR